MGRDKLWGQWAEFELCNVEQVPDFPEPQFPHRQHESSLQGVLCAAFLGGLEWRGGGAGG